MIRALIVEDERRIRNGLEKHIRWNLLGIDEIRCAERPDEALEICREYIPDILISDIRMPGMTGIELSQKLRGKFQNLQLVFISGYSDKEYLMAAIDLGVAGYVEKPIDTEEFGKAVGRAVANVHKFRKEEPVEQVQQKETGENCGDDVKNHYRIKQVISVIEKEIDSPSLSLQMLADSVYITPAYLSALFKKQVGKTISQYIVDQRIEKAQFLLADPKYKLYQVSRMVGYEDSNYFAKIFKKQVGLTPSEYREQQLR